MKNKILLCLFILLIMSSCKPQKQTTTTQSSNIVVEQSRTSTQPVPTFTKEDVDKALTFINSYVDRCNQRLEFTSNMEWIYASGQTTELFNTTLQTMLQEAETKDPELGLGADPLFNAQDYPEAGGR